MSKVRLVIEIDSDTYVYIRSMLDAYLTEEKRAIYDGILLPRMHGDLIDRSELKKQALGGDYNGCGGFTQEYVPISAVDEAKVIIPHR